MDDKGWYCHKKSKGGVTAIDYLVEIKGYGLVEAVCKVLGESPQERSYMPTGTKKARSQSKSNPVSSHADPIVIASAEKMDEHKRPPFALPLRHKDNNRVIAYLQSRGIDRDVIMDCIARGVLFESKHYHNAVFLGKDEHGKTKFAAMRSVTTNFMRDADGSDKRYGFLIPPDNPSATAAALYESPIDCLSHQTLCKQGYIPDFDGWRLSLGGTSILALEHFLEQNPHITHCIICTDADEAGDKVAEKIAAISSISTERSRPAYGTDWNDMLQAVKKAERTQGKARDSPQL